MQTYFLPRTLRGSQKPDKDVQVLFAVQPNRKAVLFIHGFSGNAINTWTIEIEVTTARPLEDIHVEESRRPELAPDGRVLHFLTSGPGNSQISIRISRGEEKILAEDYKISNT